MLYVLHELHEPRKVVRLGLVDGDNPLEILRYRGCPGKRKGKVSNRGGTRTTCEPSESDWRRLNSKIGIISLKGE